MAFAAAPSRRHIPTLIRTTSRLSLLSRTTSIALPSATSSIVSPSLSANNKATHHVQLLCFSSSSSSHPVNVTLTQSNNNTNDDGNNDDAPKLKKSSDQIMEEKILSLQSELRLHHRSANYTSALSTSTTLLNLTLEHFGKYHPATASAYNNIGLMNKYLGRYEAAKEAYELSLSIYGEVCGKDHGSYATALSNLGMLERGRVLEVDSEEEDDDDTDSNDDSDESSSMDNDYNTKKKAKLTTLDRLQLNEVAIEYFDEAYRIRNAEYGPSHPHTVSSRSQLGSAMAYAVIMERRNKLSAAIIGNNGNTGSGSGGSLLENELRNVKRELNINSEEELERHVPLALARAASKSMDGTSSSRLSQRRWDAAHDHLRGALETAVGDPRGESVRPLEYLPISSSGSDNDDDNSTANSRGMANATTTNKGLFVKDKSSGLSKKEKRKASKEARREKRLANANALRQHNDGNSESGNKIAILGVAGKVTTLSSATAAQNLAVFLKNYCDWMQLSLLNDDNNDSNSSNIKSNNIEGKEQRVLQLKHNIQEARHLYEAALHVRSSLLPPHHPDVVATKFSLAELLDAPSREGGGGVLAEKFSYAVVGRGSEADVKRANALREEILSAYNVEEKDDDDDDGATASS
eukprot:scaffold5730_cov55-Cyclotella_meneghiniana.AAC.4